MSVPWPWRLARGIACTFAYVVGWSALANDVGALAESAAAGTAGDLVGPDRAPLLAFAAAAVAALLFPLPGATPEARLGWGALRAAAAALAFSSLLGLLAVVHPDSPRTSWAADLLFWAILLGFLAFLPWWEARDTGVPAPPSR